MTSESTREIVYGKYVSVRSTQNGVYATDSSGFDQLVENSVIRGDNIKDWRRVISAGGNATTDLIGVRFKIGQVKSSFTARQDYPTLGGIWAQAKVEGYPFLMNTSPTFNQVSLITANNGALVRFYQHLASVNSKFKGLVFAGELRETLNAIRHPARALRNGVGSYLTFLKRGGRKPPSQRLSFVRKTWLEYAFGWRPLISDIDKAIDAFYRSKSARAIFEMVSGDFADDYVASSFDLFTVNGANYHIHFYNRQAQQAHVKIRGITSSFGRGSLNSHSYGFNPVEFVPTVWELIPYSFLVDYFTNIGDIIQSWSYRFIETNWTSRTIRFTSSTEVVDPKAASFDDIPGSIPSFSGTIGPSKVEVSTVNRQRTYVLELPQFQLQCPGMDARWVNILALTANLTSTRNILRS
jgi:hypothetical protein